MSTVLLLGLYEVVAGPLTMLNLLLALFDKLVTLL